MRFLILLLFLSGCASYVSRGDHFLENGSYEDAISMYEKALKHGPNDDAQIGLEKAREGWLSKKLIEVRLLRIAGSVEPANVLLKDILAKEVAWNSFPSGAATFTQEEECTYSAHSVLDAASKDLKAGLTLKAALSLETYRSFFESASLKKPFENVERSMKKQGTETCGKLTKQIRPSDYYFGLFTQRYCSYFGAKLPDLSVQKKSEAKHLFGELDLAVYGVPPGSHIPAMMREVFLQDLRGTPWFDKDGEAYLHIEDTTSFKSTHEQEATTLDHRYVVQVPHYDTRTEHRYDPKDHAHASASASSSSSFFDTVGAVLSLAGAVAGIHSDGPSHSEHDNGDGTVTITDMHYEPEPRYVSYAAIDHRQVFNFATTARLVFDGVPVEISISKDFEHHAIENHTSMPEFGLVPREPDLLSDDDWSRTQIQSASTLLKLKAMNAWDRKYCTDAPSVSADLVFKCWHVGSQHLPRTFTNWFSSTFGITPEQSEALLGDIKI